MRDHLPQDALHTGPQQPPHDAHQEPPLEDISRSHSYCLTRGGRLLLSVPWAADGAPCLLSDMHALHSSGKATAGKPPPRSPSTDTDSDSGDTDDTSEDEYEVGSGRAERHCSEEEQQPRDLERDESTVEGECSDGVGAGDGGGWRAGQRVPGDGHSPPNIVRHVRPAHATDEFTSDSDCDDNDSDDDSESDETESTVRAKPGAMSGTMEDCSGGAAQAGQEDPNDTLSTVSGDLSFDEPDAGSPPPPPPDQEAADLRRDSPAADQHDRKVVEEPPSASSKRAAPEGERCTPQREGVRAGVFCLSGYPREGAGGPSSATLGQCQGNVVLDEPVGDIKRGEGPARPASPHQLGSDNHASLPPLHHRAHRPATHSRVAYLRSSWDASTSSHQPSSAAVNSVRGTVADVAPLSPLQGAQQDPGGGLPTIPAAQGRRGVGGGSSSIVAEVHSSRRHEQQPRTYQHRSKPEQQQPRLQQQQPHPRSSRQQELWPPTANRKDNNSPICSTREGVCGGAAPPVPKPRAPRAAGASLMSLAPPARLAAGACTPQGSLASSGYASCAALAVSTRQEDSEDLSDVSSGATSEDSGRRRRRRSAQGEASVSGNEDFEWVRTSPMLTSLLEGHVTRLATPPDHRTQSLKSSLATPPESGEEGIGGPTHHYRQYSRPPPVPRPRTLEVSDLVPHRPIRDAIRDGFRDSRDSLRDRLYSPSWEITNHRRSRDSSVERSGRDSSCERGSVSSLHHHNHHLTSHLPQHPCDCPSCWCDDDEPGYDSCDERHHYHRHSYHEGLHHAHLHQFQPHHYQQSGRELSCERRNRGHGSGDSGRSSPYCCRHCHQLGSLSSLSSHDYCNNNRLTLPCTTKGGSLEDRVNRLEGDKDSLQLQVTVLSEQIEAQTEKITDLEKLLEQRKEQLQNTEEQLQKEVITRSSLETQRLELFSEISNLKLRQAAYERENIELREKIRRSDHQSDHAKAQLAAQLTNSPSPSSISTLSTIPASSPNKSPVQPTTTLPASSPIASHDGREFLPPRTPPPNARRKIEQFGTVPRQREAGVCGENSHGAPAAGRTKGVMFGKGFHFLPFRVAGKRSTSAPNLAETEMQMIDDLPEGEYYQHGDGIIASASSSPRCNTLSGHRSPPTHHKATGIKKIFTRLRRSSSGHLDSDLGEGDFRRGGMRATASARLGWTSPTNTFKEPSDSLISWSVDTVEAWLGALGLSQYCSAVRSWSSSGHHLSRATPQQLERELGIRHPLHRKKLQLGIAARLSGDQISTPLSRLDHSWVLRWLDDVGLPQYKDAFSEARIDGRVLNCLTYDDLSFLRLTNLLHVTSLKRGIQVLREHNFDPSVLKRRSVPDEDQRTRTAAEVALWTNHRVMEWLRTVDLSEYAPNLRGSGVHGALMVYEVRFTSELLASLLSIPCGKTLLRRHLNTHFKELVGRSVVQEKRELEAASGYTPLTTSAKVKMPKKSQFSLKRKKSKSDLEFDDLLCPLDEKPPVGAMQDREKEMRTGEVEKINSLMAEEVIKKVNTEMMEENNGDGRL